MISLQFLLMAFEVCVTPITGAILLVAFFMGLTFVIFIGYGIFAAFARTKLLQSTTTMRWFNRSFAAIFTALGLRLALEKA